MAEVEHVLEFSLFNYRHDNSMPMITQFVQLNKCLSVNSCSESKVKNEVGTETLALHYRAVISFINWSFMQTYYNIQYIYKLCYSIALAYPPQTASSYPING